MEKSVEKSVEQVKQEIMQEMQEAVARTKESGIVFKKIRAPKSSLAQVLKTPEQAKRFRFMLNAVKNGLI